MGTVTNNFFNSVTCFNFWKMQAIIKKRPSRNINVQNFWLYIFGMLFNLVAICVQDFDAVINKWVLMISSFHAIIFVTVHDIELLTIHFKWTIWCRGFFHGYSFITILMILNHALRYWQLDHVIIIFQCFPFGLSFVLPFFRSNHRFVFCLLCSGIAVSMVMKYADNIVKVRTIIFFQLHVLKTMLF